MPIAIHAKQGLTRRRLLVQYLRPPARTPTALQHKARAALPCHDFLIAADMPIALMSDDAIALGDGPPERRECEIAKRAGIQTEVMTVTLEDVDNRDLWSVDIEPRPDARPGRILAQHS